MSTIKDVAERAGVSTATVSYVINGKAESRGIAPATRQRVMDAVAQLGYRPSQAARRLRSTPANKPVFVLFWPLDSRASWLGMFLAAFQRAIVETEADCELLIQTYRNGEIQSAYEGANSNAYSGLIIGATSTADMTYLEQQTPRTPTVLINRPSTRFSTVTVSAQAIAQATIELLASGGVTQVGMVRTAETFLASQERMEAVASACHEAGIEIAPDAVWTVENSYEGGIEAARRWRRHGGAPRLLLCESDAITLGIEREAYRLGLHIPRDLQLIAIGSVDDNLARFALPTITTVQLPSEAIACASMDLLLQAAALTDPAEALKPQHVEVAPLVCPAESFSV